MVIFPSIAFLSAQKGISLWASSVLPALLPFFICANFMNGMGITRILKPSAFAFTMSIMSGYPMGAKIVGDMKRSGYISLNESKRMLSFCSTSGPTFMIGAVGIGMLGGAAYGAVIAIAHYIGALLNGLFFSMIVKKEKGQKNANILYKTYKNEKKDMLELFTEAITSSFKSLGIILAYIVLLMFLTDLIQFSGVLNIFTEAYMKALAKGLMEMTVGCSSMASCVDISSAWKCILCTFMISLGGLSVIGQTISMLAGSKINVSYFISIKLVHALFSSIIAFILMFFVL